MASSPAERTASPVAFALQELIACWDQGYEALVRGDLDRVQALLDIADGHATQCGDGSTDGDAEAQLRQEARSARGRLEHGMKAGLAGIDEELARVRRGGKVLRGYANASLRLNDGVLRDA
jgi:hypothetical protein